MEIPLIHSFNYLVRMTVLAVAANSLPAAAAELPGVGLRVDVAL